MKPISRISIVAVLVAGAVVILIYQNLREPRYQGISLSGWLTEYLDARFRDRPFPDPGAAEQSAARAVKEIGTNAIPTLLKWLRARKSPVRERLNSLLEKQRMVRFHFRTDSELIWFANWGFAILGDDAMPAVPALVQLMQSQDPHQRIAALSCAASIPGDRAILSPLLQQWLHDPDQNIQYWAAFYLDKFSRESAAVTTTEPTLERSTTNKLEENSRAPNR
jgi:HEAT repeat protein